MMKPPKITFRNVSTRNMISLFMSNSGLRPSMLSCSDSVIRYFKSTSLITVKSYSTLKKKQSSLPVKKESKAMKHLLKPYKLKIVKWLVG